METRDYLPADVARVFDRLYRPILAKYGRDYTLDRLPVAVERIYGALPSGDYGRGDVRAAILAACDPEGDV